MLNKGRIKQKSLCVLKKLLLMIREYVYLVQIFHVGKKFK